MSKLVLNYQQKLVTYIGFSIFCKDFLSTRFSYPSVRLSVCQFIKFFNWSEFYKDIESQQLNLCCFMISYRYTGVKILYTLRFISSEF